MELAQMYFPAIAPRSAWRRMKDLLRESSTTAELAEQSRRGVAHLRHVWSTIKS